MCGSASQTRFAVGRVRTFVDVSDPIADCDTKGGVVARAGLEPATFHFSGERCYQLSYLANRYAITAYQG